VTFAVITTPGNPVGKGRPRHVRATGRVYTPDTTKAAEKAVRTAWEAAGSPYFGTAPLNAHLTLIVPRPAAHFKRDGKYSAAGLRAVFCTRKPDVDNALKLQLDSLNGLAYEDDCQIVSAFVCRSWSTTRNGASVLRLRVEHMPGRVLSADPCPDCGALVDRDMAADVLNCTRCDWWAA
jgi:Holliday junction resolvase RusA-like endonuclease